MAGKYEAFARNIIKGAKTVADKVSGKTAAQSGRGLLNWAMAHPKTTGAVIGGGIGYVATGGDITGMAIGAGIGWSGGALAEHRANIKLGDLQSEYGAKLEGATAQEAKKIRADYNEAKKGVVEKSRILSAQESRETRRANIARMRGQEGAAIKEAKVSEAAARRAKEPKQYRQVEKRQLKKGVIGASGQTEGKFKIDGDGKTWTLGYNASAGDNGYYAKANGGHRMQLDKDQWFAHVREAEGGLKGATDEAIEAAMFETKQVAEEISQTAVGDSSGIFEGGFSNFVREHPIGTAIGAVAGGYVLSNALDDD